jgi:lysophospholipase L1-like esterase
VKIIFLGDSLTWGGYGGNFVAEIARMHPEHEIVNAGVGGNTVINLLDRLDAVIEQEPDGVFVMIGGNDAISYSQPDTRPYYRKSHNIPDGVVTREQFTQTYRDLLTRLQLAFIQTWVGLPPMEYNPATVVAMRDYNNRAREVARPMNIPVLDLMAAFQPDHVPERPALNLRYINQIGERSASGWSDYETEQQAGGFTFTFDGLHPTPASAAELAHQIAAFIDL